MASKMLQGSPILMGDNTIPGLKVPPEIEVLIPTIKKEVRDFGCDFFEPIIVFSTYDEISELAAYGGFPRRYPHWIFGMEYEQLARGYEYGMHRISEMVINNDPAIIYCLDSNTIVDNVDVIAHALGHSDFFKHNIFFEKTDRNMLNKMANHGTMIRDYMAKWGKERVVALIDRCMMIDTLIDPMSAWTERKIEPAIKYDKKEKHLPELAETDRDYMDPWLNSKDRLKKEYEKIERKEAAEYLGLLDKPIKDIFGYLKDNAPLKAYERDIMSMIYEESLYFHPQRITKTINEGWACQKRDALVYTDSGILTIGEIVDNKLPVNVFDGNQLQKVSNWFKFENRKTVKIVTNRGYILEGSDNHRLLVDNNWKQLKEFNVDDKIDLYCSNLWSNEYVKLDYKLRNSIQLLDIASRSGKNYEQIAYYKYHKKERKNSEINLMLEEFEHQGNLRYGKRKDVQIPEVVDENLASFFGYMIGDGHISLKKRLIGLTTGDKCQADNFEMLVSKLFNLKCNKRWDDSSKNGRSRSPAWRISVYSRNLQDFLVKCIGMKTGISARVKVIPECIFKSPKSVISAFIRSYFDSDGYAGKQGVVLFTTSEELGKQIQLLLLNYGILSSRKIQKDGCWHVCIRGKSAVKFRDEINFGLPRKLKKLDDYINNHCFFVEEKLYDKVVKIEYGFDDVFDISVENTHCYVSQAFMNHNSFVDFKLLTERGLASLGQKTNDGGIVEYAIHKMQVLGGKYSMNPYNLGFEMFMDIEDRWNKGRFGKEYEECTDMITKKKWDKKLGLGHEKVFEVRKNYNDWLMILDFFTPEFCHEKEFYDYKRLPNGEYIIVDRDYNSIKTKLLKKFLNGGLPDIRLTDANGHGKGWFILQHFWDGRPLYPDYVGEVIRALQWFWQENVVLATKKSNGEELIYLCNGQSLKKNVHIFTREEYDKEVYNVDKSIEI